MSDQATKAPSDITPPRQQRAAITQTQKQALRAWAMNQIPAPRGSQCIEWFQRAYGRRLSQSSVSDILSEKFAYLDSAPASAARRRQKAPRWPRLETKLIEWFDSNPNGIQPPTGEAIVTKARELWNEIPEYQTMPSPLFSQGWLDRLKRRLRDRDAEATGARVVLPNSSRRVETPQSIDQARRHTKVLRTMCGEFDEDDIYNVDEAGLCWRKPPFLPSPTQSVDSMDKENSRICLILCTNATGSDRLPLWIIGHSQMPQALRNVNRDAMAFKWLYNVQAWLTQSIMQQWLLSFYKHVGDRRVLLLLDNLPDHHAAVRLTPPPSNVHIHHLPISKTSSDDEQPLTLGITQNLKQHYRQEWLSFMVRCKESSTDSVHMMSLFHAVSWITRIWRHDITHGTVYKAFRKSALIDRQIAFSVPSKAPNLTSLYQTVTRDNPENRHVIHLEGFINPVDEDLYCGAGVEGLDGNDDAMELMVNGLDDAFVPTPIDQFVPTSADAVVRLQSAIRYLVHQPWATAKDVEALERTERMMNRISADERR